MTAAGWWVLGVCWTGVTFFSAYLVYLTLRTPRPHEEGSETAG